jgi:uncharacterized protein YegP (UPF0339 family)
MKANYEMLEVKLKNYEGQLKGLHSYIKELKDKTAEHGTQSEYYGEDLMEAEHNVEFYEGELARIRELIAEEPEGTTYVVYKDASEKWRWQLRAGNNLIIADSGEGYRNKQDCLHGITLVKDSKDAPVKEKQ